MNMNMNMNEEVFPVDPRPFEATISEETVTVFDETGDPFFFIEPERVPELIAALTNAIQKEASETLSESRMYRMYGLLWMIQNPGR